MKTNYRSCQKETLPVLLQTTWIQSALSVHCTSLPQIPRRHNSVTTHHQYLQSRVITICAVSTGFQYSSESFVIVRLPSLQWKRVHGIARVYLQEPCVPVENDGLPGHWLSSAYYWLGLDGSLKQLFRDDTDCLALLILTSFTNNTWSFQSTLVLYLLDLLHTAYLYRILVLFWCELWIN